MERPVMQPSFLDEVDTHAKPPRRKIQIVRPVLRFIGRVLLAEPFSASGRRSVSVEGVPLHTRIVKGLMYRLAFVPIVASAAAVAIVFAGTHPPTKPIQSDPAGMGLYFETVKFATSDGVNLEAWVVPVYEAEKILLEGTKGLNKKQPAVLLVHDFAGNREEMLPLVKPLRDAGLVVMVVGLRGNGENAPMGQTFGLRESQDVSAAIAALRKRPYVDEKHVAVLGLGTGATAAMLAVDRDPTISAMVMDQPPRTPESVVERIAPPAGMGLTWMKPLCRWTFELAYKVDLNDLDTERLAHSTKDTPCLVLQRSSEGMLNRQAMGQVAAFLGSKLATKSNTVASLPKN
jgi:pimeloyl-ACP methyl ester carboxylesterase